LLYCCVCAVSIRSLRFRVPSSCWMCCRNRFQSSPDFYFFLIMIHFFVSMFIV
jgi:hypothetical protein